MVDLMKAFGEFWNGTGIQAFPENAVPEKDIFGNPVKMPFIKYEYAAAERTIITGIIYVKETDSSIRTLSELSGQINDALPPEGVFFRLSDRGEFMELWRENPWMQPYPQEDKDIKANVFNVGVRTKIY